MLSGFAANVERPSPPPTNNQSSMDMQVPPFLRHAVFTSQADLFHWIERSRSCNLKKVRTLELHLTDIDLSSFLEPNSGGERRSPGDLWTLYEDDLRKLDHALHLLPELSRLKVVPPEAVYSHFVRSLYTSFLEMLSHRFSALELRIVEEINEAQDVNRTSSEVDPPAPAIGRSASKTTSTTLRELRKRRTAHKCPEERRIQMVCDSKERSIRRPRMRVRGR
ncbi:hypothetical protein BAUCODRAFT_133752 [Baudoinia panamericana UAMH 10762]|uniref:Uncharacterized protein n=1 Tax=Baudoinia panamericana (strain UAMH 10762) TaxID=717646 RepID=M2N1J3_BAUPA|nr:uncharacterized protein BAUCODRAFT_133752 [Baudoinia panamericana UAMH 10762]EMC92824.1 hypothetical protein BAUCODRAFT_133752 [Baudoinia panamericana UAMH 10762]